MSSDVLYIVRSPKGLFEMTWEEVSEALKETDIAILPVGSTEQHGRHLPLGSDSIQGTDIARIVVERLGRDGITVVAAPTIPFGISHAHMKFPGSIPLSSGTLMAVIREVVLSLHAHSFRRFVILPSHGGNLRTLNMSAQELALELPDARFIVPDWLPVMGARYPEVIRSDRPKEEHHSGEGETARMLASTPNLVKMDRAMAFYPDEKVDPYRERPHLGPVVLTGGGGHRDEGVNTNRGAGGPQARYRGDRGEAVQHSRGLALLRDQGRVPERRFSTFRVRCPLISVRTADFFFICFLADW